MSGSGKPPKRVNCRFVIWTGARLHGLFPRTVRSVSECPPDSNDEREYPMLANPNWEGARMIYAGPQLQTLPDWRSLLCID